MKTVLSAIALHMLAISAPYAAIAADEPAVVNITTPGGTVETKLPADLKVIFDGAAGDKPPQKRKEELRDYILKLVVHEKLNDSDLEKVDADKRDNEYFVLRSWPRNAEYLAATDQKERVEFAREYAEWLFEKQWQRARQFVEKEMRYPGADPEINGDSGLASYALAQQLKGDITNGASLETYKRFVSSAQRLAFASNYWKEHKNKLRVAALRTQAKAGRLSDDFLQAAVMDAAELDYRTRAMIARPSSKELATPPVQHAFEGRKLDTMLDHYIEQRIVAEKLLEPLFAPVSFDEAAAPKTPEAPMVVPGSDDEDGDAEQTS